MTQVLEKKKTRRLLWVLVMAALVIAAAAVATVWLLRRDARGQQGNNTVWVNDGVNIVPIVPAPDVEVNTLSPEDFAAQEDGTIRYTGRYYIARQGIDISEYQGAVDWQQAADGGVEFAYIRAGYRGATAGGLYTDSTFEENFSRARDAGVAVGVYFLSQATDEQEAAEEAEYLLDLLGDRTTQLPIMFDWETVNAEGSRSKGVDGETVHRCALAFCRRIEESGREAGIYFSRQQGYYCYDLAELDDYTFWVSDPNVQPDFYYAFEFWQYSFSGTVPGIDGAVDRNLWLIPVRTD